MTVRLVAQSFEPVVPQAIFWRPIVYFTLSYRKERDDLDEYEVASFQIGNRISFDLRHYLRHPPFTASLYLPFEIDDQAEVTAQVDDIVGELKVPETATAWKRGMEFRYGDLNRNERDRLTEAEARILALKVASTFPGHTASMQLVKQEIDKYFEPSPIDLRDSRTRKEPMWKQIVGNVISHKGSNRGIFKRGLAKRTSNGMTVTPDGLDYLKSIGFSAEE